MPATLPVLLSFVGADGRYEYVDVAYQEWFSAPPEDIVGRRVGEVVGPRAWQSIRPHVESALAGNTVSFEQVVPYAGAGERCVSVDYIPRRGGDGFVDGFFAIVRDVTERKSLERDLLRAQKMEAVGKLASAIAHDFRNALMGIHGMASMARDSLHDPETVERYLTEIQHAARSGSDAVRHLLSYARPSAAEGRSVMVDDAVTRMHRMLDQVLSRGIELELDLDAPGAAVRCSPGQIEQVLVNLGLNACDAMPAGGRLVIRTRADADQVQLIVSDTGVGMDADTLDRVTDPFFSTKAGGTGLGLFSVLGLVQRCGGDLRLMSEPGRGTTVQMLLPRAPARTDPEESGVRPRVPPSLEVLVVEDESLVRLAVRHYLEKRGCAVVEADDAESAMAAVRGHPGIALAVVDVTLGVIPGPELVQRIDRALRPIPALYVSAYPKRLLVEDGILGPDDVALEKPFDEEALIAAVHQVLANDEKKATEIAIK